MNHSFLFFLCLVLLVGIATSVDVIRWTETFRRRVVLKRKKVEDPGIFLKGSAADRKEQ